MTHDELRALIRNGEDSLVEFKRDEARGHDVAKELAAFLNLEGGVLLLGVGDDGRITGAARGNLEEWVAELCRSRIEPPVVPLMSWARGAEPGRDVLAVRVPRGADKPYARVHAGRRTYYIRVGSTSREASREELARMYQASGQLLYGSKPASGADLDALDRRRLREWLTRVVGGTAPDDEDVDEWETLLGNVDLMTAAAGRAHATIDGALLFGRAPNRHVPQAGIRAVCYPGAKPEYATRADEDLRGPMVALRAADGSLVEIGLVEMAWDFVRRNTPPGVRFDGPRRIDIWPYPEAVVREAVVNALVHRDYSIAGTDIMLAIYSDRLEIQSPGRLPNTMTPEKMRGGARYARSQTLVNVMRDYGYVEGRGMGVRNMIVPGMKAHNGTEPELIAEDYRFTMRLWNAPQP